MALDLNGIIINEILPQANANSPSSDTDDNGTFNSLDEFVELYNTGTNSVDINGWTITDSSSTTSITLNNETGPTVIAPGEKLTVVVDYAVPRGGLLPAGFYDAGLDNGFSREGEIITLSNGTNSITASYGSQDTSGNSNGEYFGISPVSNSGHSLQRTPDGADVFASNLAPTPGAVNPECFLTGTRILTESGYKLVEELSIGDKVHTAEGELVDVKWIGYQTIDPNNLAIALRGNPVLVKAGALGNNLPARDLYISPDHSLFVEGLLINAGALVNGVSIVQTEPTETFVYHSVELENHALLTVEGTYAESYMPHHEDRTNYDNGSEYEELYPHGSNLMLWPMDYPRISSKTQVPSFVSQKLSNIAQQLEGILLSA